MGQATIKKWTGGGGRFPQLTSQLARRATKHSSAGEPLPPLVWVQISQLDGLTHVPLAFLWQYNESIQSTIPVPIPGKLAW